MGLEDVINDVTVFLHSTILIIAMCVLRYYCHKSYTEHIPHTFHKQMCVLEPMNNCDFNNHVLWNNILNSMADHFNK